MKALPEASSDYDKQKILNLQAEVENYRAKIAHYQLLEKELNDISESIVSPKASSISISKDQPNRKASEDSKPMVARRSSNKKIKMYELQKKLKKLLSEFKQKQSAYYGLKSREKELLSSIETLSRRITDERQAGQTLNDLLIKITRDIDQVEQKEQTEIEALEESIKNKEMFNFQRRKLRDQLRKLRNSISRSNIQFNEQELSLSLSEDQHPLENQTQVQCLLTENDLGWADRELNRVHSLMAKSELYRQQNSQSLDNFYKFKKQFTGNEIQAKHHRMTIELQSSQLKTYEHLILETKMHIASIRTETERVNEEVKAIEGQRGYLRGKVGILIEEQRLVRGVNVLLESDLQRLREKLGLLSLLRKLFDKLN